MTIYCTPEKFERFSRGKNVKHFPNEWIKEVNGITCHIVKPDLKCIVEKVEEDSFPWYLRMDKDTLAKVTKDLFGYSDTEVYRLTCDWFPEELVAGVSCGRYSSFTTLSNKTGYLEFGYAGSNSCFFIGSKVNEAIKILRRKGFMFEPIKK